MSILLCYLKGCGIDIDGLGYVKCPDCQRSYCWDRHFVYYRNDRPSDYPFGGWRPCGHGISCKNRRVHKRRKGDTPSSYISKGKEIRYERLKEFSEE